MTETTIFIVEDDSWFTEFLMYHIRLVETDATIKQFKSGKQLLASLHEQPSIITLDYNLPDANGKDLLKIIKDKSPQTKVIIVSGSNDLKLAVELLKEGAYDYILKDTDTKERIWNTFRNISETIALNKEVTALRKESNLKKTFSNTIIGNSRAMLGIFSLLQRSIESSINVSIFGETGTGKELIAQYIHSNSSASNAPFVAINLGAIPRELAESELFGHEKGSFTGAFNQRIGKFEEAGEGTLFLDEVGELDPMIQVKLLRVLQEKEVTRIGGNKPIKINCRIISATHKNLETEVAEGRFREDLYYRLMGLTIQLPALRHRGGDAILLAEHFLADIALQKNAPAKLLSTDAKEKLTNYYFPGNIRELRSIIELAEVLSDDQIIQSDHLQFRSVQQKSVLEDSTQTLHELTLQIIRARLLKYKNDYQRVANELGIGKSTIYRLLKEDKEKNSTYSSSNF